MTYKINLNTMSVNITDDGSREDNNVLEYTRMIVPSSMRSHYWKYFGFPSDNYNNIITKKKVICVLCNTAIAYNKNTTNLRTHLVAKHTELLYEFTNDKKNVREAPLCNSNNSIKRLKITNKREIVQDLESIQTEEVQLKISDSNTIIEAFGKNEIIGSQSEKSENNDYQYFSTSPEQQNYQIEEIDESNIKGDESVNDALLDILVKDLLPPSIVEGTGFINFSWTLAPTVNVPQRSEIETSINKLHDSKFVKIMEILKSHASEHSFSLGFEIWENVAKKKLVTIYINYIPQDEEPTLTSVLFQTVEITKNINFNKILQDINIKNCSAALINIEDAAIIRFLANNDIPITSCFETVIQRCLTSAFKLSAVDLVITDIISLLDDNTGICENVDLLTQIHEEFPLTKFNFLQIFYEKFSNGYTTWSSDVTEYLNKAKEIIECLAPLKMTLETLIDEPFPVSSLLRPLTTKLLTHHFSSFEEDSQIILDMKETIVQELSASPSVMDSNFLTVSAFLDPRFQNHTTSDVLELIKEILNQKFEALKDDDGSKSKIEKRETCSRKSSLKLFFNNNDTKCVPKVFQKSWELEVAKYTQEVCADLEQCPLTWWHEFGYMYRQLNKIAQNYICVPASLNMIFKRKIEEQIDYYDKRFMLRGKIGNQLLFLHFNRSIIN